MDAIFLTLDIMSLEVSVGLVVSIDAVFLTLDIRLLEISGGLIVSPNRSEYDG